LGDAAAIRASDVRNQKTYRPDPAHMLKLLIENRFSRLWRPSAEVRDLRQASSRSSQFSKVSPLTQKMEVLRGCA
jgi:hypothetical protein